MANLEGCPFFKLCDSDGCYFIGQMKFDLENTVLETEARRIYLDRTEEMASGKFTGRRRCPDLENVLSQVRIEREKNL